MYTRNMPNPTRKRGRHSRIKTAPVGVSSTFGGVTFSLSKRKSVCTNKIAHVGVLTLSFVTIYRRQVRLRVSRCDDSGGTARDPQGDLSGVA